jgi:hypothetical protein
MVPQVVYVLYPPWVLIHHLVRLHQHSAQVSFLFNAHPYVTHYCFYCSIAGYYGATTGLSSAACSGQCPAGYYCLIGSSSPIPCVAGTYGGIAGISYSSCSGACAVNYWCQAGSTSAYQNACPANSITAAGATTAASCQCINGYQGYSGKPCYDKLQCENAAVPLCMSRSACMNTLAGFYCIPWLPSSTLTLISGGAVSLQPVIELNTTLPGQATLSFEVYLGNGSSITDVRYGPADQPLIYGCLSRVVTYISLFERHARIECQLGLDAEPVGFGAGLAFTVTSCNSESSMCTSGRGNDTFAYPRPTITSGTLRLSGDTVGTTLLELTTSFSVSIQMNGTGFSNDPSRMMVTYGPASKRSLFTCALVPEQTTSTLLYCFTDSGGVGTQLEFQIHYGGLPGPVIGTDRLSYPTNQPAIERVHGCPTNDGITNGTAECPTSGSVWITITGVNFNPPVGVFVSGDACAPLRNAIGTTQIECLLPSGTGQSQSVVVSSVSQFSAPVKTLSFAAPNITGVTGCVDTQLTSQMASTIGCNRDGGQIITITGTNFGVRGATILIGNTVCGSTTHDPITPHTKLRCTLPSSSLENRPVVVVQLNGAVSSSIGLVSYTQCSPGTYETALACTSCSVGSYSSSYSATTCTLCDNGHYQNSTGQSACPSCLPGKYSVKNGTYNGASVCNDCESGTYTAAFSQSQCIPCAIGEFVASSGSLSCTKCPTGTSQSTTGATSCNNCTSGSYSSDIGAIQCTLCSIGSYQPQNGMSVFASDPANLC